MTEASIKIPDIKNVDITRLMVIVLEQSSAKPPMNEAVSGKFFAHIMGKDITLVIADPMVNRLPSVVMWSDQWKIRADLPKNWPRHLVLNNSTSKSFQANRERFPVTTFTNKHVEGAEALVHDLTLLRVFF